MNRKSGIDSIHIQPGYYGREATKVMSVAGRLGYKMPREWSSGCAVIGSVGYCESKLGFAPRPDFYPEWAKEWLRRDVAVLEAEDGEVATRTCFVKSADKYKAFPAEVIHAGQLLPAGNLAVSDVVEFRQEWRYYIADGCILASGWYDGVDDNEPSPHIDVDWPDGWCGAADFGRLSNGTLAIVEFHHPYACGWYGDDHDAYAMWVVEGWQWLLSQSPERLAVK